jgi:hypothetical protein
MSAVTLEHSLYDTQSSYLTEAQDADADFLSQYWNWGRWAADPEKSPIFDGSMLSMSGNGEALTHQGQIVTGNGGGCITSGPFKK